MTFGPEGETTVLIVDDTPENLSVLHNLLGTRYRCQIATSGSVALEIARRSPQPDLILLDVVMTGMDGFEVCRRLKADPVTEGIPVIFLTVQSDARDEQEGLELGAVDYIMKPISPALVLARVRTHLHLKATRDFLKDKSEYLEAEVVRRTSEIGMIQDIAMVALGSLAETRDNETGAHIRRTQHFMKLLADKAAKLPEFQKALPEETIILLYKSAPLHDIGKVGIPDHILLKPGRLTPQEFEVMKTHTVLGTQAIQAAERHFGKNASFLKSISFLEPASEIALSHHERWDGAGYPLGLAGENIPLSGRLMAVADVYDALRSERVYKPPYPHEKAVSLIQEGQNGQFDPRLVDIFLKTADEWRDIYRAYRI